MCTVEVVLCVIGILIFQEAPPALKKKKKKKENQRFAVKYTEAKGKTLYGQLEILVLPGNCSL